MAIELVLPCCSRRKWIPGLSQLLEATGILIQGCTATLPGAPALTRPPFSSGGTLHHASFPMIRMSVAALSGHSDYLDHLPTPQSLKWPQLQNLFGKVVFLSSKHEDLDIGAMAPLFDYSGHLFHKCSLENRHCVNNKRAADKLFLPCFICKMSLTTHSDKAPGKLNLVQSASHTNTNNYNQKEDRVQQLKVRVTGQFQHYLTKIEGQLSQGMLKKRSKR